MPQAPDKQRPSVNRLRMLGFASYRSRSAPAAKIRLLTIQLGPGATFRQSWGRSNSAPPSDFHAVALAEHCLSRFCGWGDCCRRKSRGSFRSNSGAFKARFRINLPAEPKSGRNLILANCLSLVIYNRRGSLPGAHSACRS
jgi:hypothetical protein